MFKKPLGNLKTSAPIRSSDRRKLKQKIVATYNLTNEDGDILVPDGLQSAKYVTHSEDPGVSIYHWQSYWRDLQSVDTLYELLRGSLVDNRWQRLG